MRIEQNLNQNTQELPEIFREVKTEVPVEISNPENEQLKVEERNKRKQVNDEKIEKVKNDILKQFGIENKEIANKTKEGVDFVFEQNPDLIKIGTKEQYMEYLDGIFPDSKVKDIVYHGTKSKDKIESFSENEIGALDNGYFGRGFYFTLDKSYASNYTGVNGHLMTVLLNIKNPLETDANQANTNISLTDYDGAIVRNGEDLAGLNEIEEDPNEIFEIVAKTAEQIHILGSGEDIAKFKEFVSSKEDQIK